MPHSLRELTVLCLALAPMVATAQEPRPETDWADLSLEDFARPSRSSSWWPF